MKLSPEVVVPIRNITTEIGLTTAGAVVEAELVDGIIRSQYGTG